MQSLELLQHRPAKGDQSMLCAERWPGQGLAACSRLAGADQGSASKASDPQMAVLESSSVRLPLKHQARWASTWGEKWGGMNVSSISMGMEVKALTWCASCAALKPAISAMKGVEEVAA